MVKRVAILHPWFPQYREPFFRKLVQTMAREQIAIEIFHGPPPPEWGARGDAVEADYATLLPTRYISVGNRSIAMKDTTPIRESGPYDLVILEQAVRNLETYPLLLRPLSSRLAFWGHGKTYTKAVSRQQEWVKRRLTNTADWFFGYTGAGVQAVVAAGFPRGRATVVVNSIDTTELLSGLADVADADIEKLTRHLDLRGKTALFLGGLDAAKRIPFLLAAARDVAANDPDFRLVVAGNGADRNIVETEAGRSPWVKYVGSVAGPEKFTLLRTAQVMVMPGRVGLVAVDSLASGLPIVTTDWPWHAPEFDYLEAGSTCIVSKDDVGDFATKLLGILNDSSRLISMSRLSRDRSAEFSIEQMVINFAAGIRLCLDKPPRRRRRAPRHSKSRT